MKISRLILLGLVLATLARADVTLAPLFVDHAILQRDRALPVWGGAEPGEHVVVAFKEQSVGTTAGADGRWIVYLDPLPASAEPADLVVAGKNTVKVSDVLVGEVWLVGGQSNMEWVVENSKDAKREIATADYPLLRHIKVDHTIADHGPLETTKTTGWLTATPANAGAFSAIGYFFGRDLVKKLGIPVGIVNSTWGGTPIEAWMSSAALQRSATWPAVNARWQKNLAESEERKAHWPAEYEAWRKADAAAKAAKKKNPVPYPQPNLGPGSPYAISVLFNGMIAPLQPYALRGFLWYQGESNWERPAEYAVLFPEMIRSWRAGWGQGDTPFYFVQLAAFEIDEPTHRAWAWLREAQTKALDLPAIGMVTAIDIGDPADIHPRNKQEVARRLALMAKDRIYGIPSDYEGPVFDSATREGHALRVRFRHAGGGLISYDKPVQSLELAGADKVFHPAAGKIDRGTLLVTSPAVKEPVAVRYAWSNAPVANLYNGAGLPCLPFRSDGF
ncbi:MAG: sialate O-acetylesterase [Verrucomicrobia bacterium]|nr:sialate O-acetylesterase [Verrucomicrobiota bacterium]